MLGPRTILILTAIALSILPEGYSQEEIEPVIDSPGFSIREDLRTVETMRNEANYQDSLGLAKEALHSAEELGDDELITEALYQISLVYYFLESFEEARAYMEIGLTHAQLHNLKALEADLLNAQGVLEWKQGNLYEATAKLETALAIRQDQNQWVSMASIANNLGIISYSLQKYAKAVIHYKQGLDWLGDNDNEVMQASLYSNLGESLIPLGRYEEAETYLMKSLEIEKRSNKPYGLAYTYFNLGELRSGQGNLKEAIRLYHKALKIQLEIGNDWSAALTRLKLAREHMSASQPEDALRELNPGYESAKAMNALTLLRDYSETFSMIYKSTGEEGLARYYSDLREWFKERAADNNANSSDPITDLVLAPVPPTVEARPVLDLSTLQIASLGLLGILIFILVLENMRLRRLMHKE